jgi:hypothetical protein
VKTLLLLSLSLLSFSTLAADLISCNNGDLIVSEGDTETYYDSRTSKQLSVTVTNQGVIKYFEERSKEEYTGASYYGGQVTIEKAFPSYVKIQGSGNNRKMVISTFTPTRDGYSTAGPGGVSLKSYKNGFDLRIDGSNMPNSHTMLIYSIGNWYFEDCTNL